MSSLVFLLEEASARNMLEAVVSRLTPPDVAVHYVTFEGKRDMERQLERKLRFWLEPDTYFIIMRDQDAEELKKITGNRYQKLAGSRAIGPCLDLSGSNSSHSFKVLVDGISRQVRRLLAAV